jgi:hypothetical protein
MSIYVLFFGGYQSTQPDVNSWLGSARAQRKDVVFDAVPYPAGAGAGGHSAVSAFANGDQYDGVITQIGTSGADQTYIVGHSSGCAIANAVDRDLIDHSHITLVALDGFVPDHKQLARPSTQVWSAVGGDGTALHYKDLKDSVGSRLQVYPAASNCTTRLALHFSLVNAAATDKIVGSIKTGYRHCKANLVWLK